MIYSSRISLVVKSKQQVVNCLNTAPYICMSSSRYVTCAIWYSAFAIMDIFKKETKNKKLLMMTKSRILFVITCIPSDLKITTSRLHLHNSPHAIKGGGEGGRRQYVQATIETQPTGTNVWK